jgi:hypothetical protein
MGWTYDPTRARLAVNKDRIRLMIGDTLPSRPLLQDEEIDVILTLCNWDLYSSCAMACDAIANKFAGDPDFNHGRIAQKRQQIVESYRRLANTFRSHAAPTVVGPSGSDYFRRGMMDHPGTASFDREEPEP